MKKNNKTIIKIGTESIISNLEIQDDFIESIAYHTAEEITKKRLIVIASSGAVGIGKEILLSNGKQIEGKTKQQLAGIGNVKLMRVWEQAFAKYGIITSQVLLNSYTVLNGNYYKHIIENAKDGIISVVNANDTLIYSQIKMDEIMVGDNDELAAKIAKDVKAKKLLICSKGINGYYNNYGTENQEMVKSMNLAEINQAITFEESLHDTIKTEGGTGGILTKLKAMREIVLLDGYGQIIDSTDSNSINNCFQGNHQGTIFTN